MQTSALSWTSSNAANYGKGRNSVVRTFVVPNNPIGDWTLAPATRMHNTDTAFVSDQSRSLSFDNALD
jgi:hypothetical protein